jgi:hypothetical protein
MRQLPWQRVGSEIGLGLIALAAAFVVILPAFVVVNWIFHAGLYQLLVSTVVAGTLLLLYQWRLRPTLREPALRAAAGLAEALRGSEAEPPAGPSNAAFRIWGGVPIAALRASLLSGTVHAGTPYSGTTPLPESLCAYVRSRAGSSPTLTWGLAEVGGSRLLLLQEPEQAGNEMPELSSVLRRSLVAEETFHHLWSRNGPASYEEPIAFATVLLAQAVSGKEAELHRLAVSMAERVAALPDISGVEVLMSESAGGTEPPRLLWLAAGSDRGIRRQVYLALEPSSSAQGLAWSMDRFDLLACDAYATLDVPLVPSPSSPFQ